MSGRFEVEIKHGYSRVPFSQERGQWEPSLQGLMTLADAILYARNLSTSHPQAHTRVVEIVAEFEGGRTIYSQSL